MEQNQEKVLLNKESIDLLATKNNITPNNNSINLNSRNNRNKKTFNFNQRNIIMILLLIIIILIIIFIARVLIQEHHLKNNNFIENEKFSIKVVGFEFKEPFELNKYNYELEINTEKVQFECSKNNNVEGCNKTIDLTNTSSYNHIIRYTSEDGEVYEYKINIIKKITNSPIKIKSIEKNVSGYTNKEILITVNAISTNNKKLKYSFDGGNTWQDDNTLVIKENQTINVIVKDEAGEVIEPVPVIINNIDNVPPTVDIIIKEKQKDKIILQAIAKDDNSGINSYNWNNNVFNNKSTYEVTKSGMYTVIVKDNAENISQQASINIPESLFEKDAVKEKYTYKVEIVANGATVSKNMVSCTTYEASCKVKLPEITRSDLRKEEAVIVGFAEDPNTTVAKYKSLEEITISENKKIYAITGRKVTVTYNKNGATSLSKSSDSCIIYSNSTSCKVTAPTITRNGYTILGFSLNSNDTTGTSNIIFNNNTTYYAITRKDLYTYFDGNGATVSKSAVGCSIYNTKTACDIITPTITRSGWEVLGFAPTSNATAATLKPNTKISINKTGTKYYAITARNITIKFNANGGINAPSQITSSTNSQIKIPTNQPTRIGYKFLGWSTSIAGSVKYKAGQIFTGNSNTTLYARWQDLYADNTSYTYNSVTSSNQFLFNKISQANLYNYAPSAFKDDNGIIHLFYVGNTGTTAIVDHIYHRTISKRSNAAGYNYSNEYTNLEHSAGKWDSVQVCDPTVIKGNFNYNGTTYKYLMVYLGVATYDNSLNQIGLAVSNDLNSRFIKVSVNSPFIPYPANSRWGAGQPTAINLDGKGQVMISYTHGVVGKTYQVVGIYDLSNLNNPVTVKAPKEVLKNGSPSYISNADIAIDLVNDLIYCTAHKGNTYEKNSVTGTVNYIPSQSLILTKKLNLKSYSSLSDAVYTALTTSTNSWSAKILSSDSYLIHNTGFIRDPYGYINGTNDVSSLTLISTAQKHGNQTSQLWSYQIRLYK